MTEHVRAQIRAAAATALRTIPGVYGVGSRVYVTRRIPLQSEHLPALLVYTLNEESRPETLSGPRYLSRDLELLIDVVAQDTTELDAVLDEIATAVETCIGAAFGDPLSELRQLLRAGNLVSTRLGVDRPASPDELGTGHAVLTYSVNYRTRSENPTLIN